VTKSCGDGSGHHQWQVRVGVEDDIGHGGMPRTWPRRRSRSSFPTSF